MNLKEKFMQLNKEKIELENKYAELKTEYFQYITDKRIPLMERWDSFICKLPQNSKLKIDGSLNLLVNF